MIISGKQINLRDWCMTDVEAYAHWQTPGQHKWQEFDGPYFPPNSEDDVAQMIDRLKKRIERGGWPDPHQVLVIADQMLDRIIGTVSWYRQDKALGPAWISLGIIIYDPSGWGQGVGYEALGLWSDYLFTAMPDINRLDLRTWSGNKGMMRLAQKLGYQQEACFRQARWLNGRFYDSLGYGMLRAEWMALYPDGFVQQLLDR